MCKMHQEIIFLTEKKCKICPFDTNDINNNVDRI